MNTPENEKIKIAPSILSADFSKMGEEVQNLEKSGADVIHCDVMDGVFVNNITFGIKMVEDLRKITKLPLDCHLMIVHPEKYAERFVKAGADYVTVHAEACGETLEDTLKLIKNAGAKCGAVINPDVLDKVRELREIIRKNNLSCDVEIDGGINAETVKLAKAAGANVIVAGSGVFKAENRAAAIEALRNL